MAIPSSINKPVIAAIEAANFSGLIRLRTAKEAARIPIEIAIFLSDSICKDLVNSLSAFFDSPRRLFRLPTMLLLPDKALIILSNLNPLTTFDNLVRSTVKAAKAPLLTKLEIKLIPLVPALTTSAFLKASLKELNAALILSTPALIMSPALPIISDADLTPFVILSKLILLDIPSKRFPTTPTTRVSTEANSLTAFATPSKNVSIPLDLSIPSAILVKKSPIVAVTDKKSPPTGKIAPNKEVNTLITPLTTEIPILKIENKPLKVL